MGWLGCDPAAAAGPNNVTRCAIRADRCTISTVEVLIVTKLDRGASFVTLYDLSAPPDPHPSESRPSPEAGRKTSTATAQSKTTRPIPRPATTPPTGR